MDTNKVEAELRSIKLMVEAAKQDFATLDVALPKSKRGTRVQRTLENIVDRMNGIELRAKDGLKEFY